MPIQTNKPNILITSGTSSEGRVAKLWIQNVKYENTTWLGEEFKQTGHSVMLLP
jgi:hypothetical protein